MPWSVLHWNLPVAYHLQHGILFVIDFSENSRSYHLDQSAVSVGFTCSNTSRHAIQQILSLKHDFLFLLSFLLLLVLSGRLVRIRSFLAQFDGDTVASRW